MGMPTLPVSQKEMQNRTTSDIILLLIILCLHIRKCLLQAPKDPVPLPRTRKIA
jgi:hypothetical protein